MVSKNDNELDVPKTQSAKEEELPIGIARLREEWRAAGLIQQASETEEQAQPVVFSETDGGIGVGDYTLTLEEVRNRLPLSDEAIDRLIASGELDSVLVKSADGAVRRLISESSFKRFLEDSSIDPDAMARAAKALADRSLVEAIEGLNAAVEDLRNNQAKVLQQMKDILLLEVRNLKEQDRDLASFVYELAEEIRRLFPKRRK
ncbi:MAG: hypothetical protein QHI38_04295 [Armatimonadota bacterium]|nr:hypothetical protein [Armatimonadota bacterium]